LSRVLLTGATGFVGRHTLTALVDAGHEVHALTRHAVADSPGVSWHAADLHTGCELVAEIEPEILVHLAWYTKHGESWSSVENVRWVEASLRLLRAFAAAGGRRAVMAGTCAEYEWSRELYSESAPLRPATLYGAAKHSLHMLASAFCRQADIELAWGRVFFLYGPFEAPERFVPSLVLPLLRGQPAPMTEGTQRRDYLHAADAGAALATLADSQVTGAVNIASGRAVELRELAHELARRLQGEELLRVGARPMPRDDPPALLADVRRLREEVGWRARIELADGLDNVIAWWREHS
jgi:nucleoside-diphosphate-sugar epimerase